MRGNQNPRLTSYIFESELDVGRIKGLRSSVLPPISWIDDGTSVWKLSSPFMLRLASDLQGWGEIDESYYISRIYEHDIEFASLISGVHATFDSKLDALQIQADGVPEGRVVTELSEQDLRDSTKWSRDGASAKKESDPSAKTYVASKPSIDQETALYLLGDENRVQLGKNESLPQRHDAGPEISTSPSSVIQSASLACRTHRRSVSAVQPNLAAIETIASHCEP